MRRAALSLLLLVAVAAGCSSMPAPAPEDRPLLGHPNPFVSLPASVGGASVAIATMTAELPFLPLVYMFPESGQSVAGTVLATLLSVSDVVGAPFHLVQIPFWMVVRSSRADYLADQARPVWEEVARANAIKAIGEEGLTDAMGSVEEGLADASPVIRWAALDAAAFFLSPDLLDSLRVVAVADPVAQHRLRALALVGATAGRMAHAIEDPEEQATDIVAIEDSESFLIRRLRVEPTPARMGAATGLGHLHEAYQRGYLPGWEGLAALTNAAGDTFPGVRLEVAWALGQIGLPDGLDALDLLARDDEYRVRAAAAEALGHIVDPDSTEIVRRIAGDENPAVRIEAAHAASLLATPEAEEIIDRLVEHDPDAQVRAAAGVYQDELHRRLWPESLGAGWWTAGR